jgi:hypothetical protein
MTFSSFSRETCDSWNSSERRIQDSEFRAPRRVCFALSPGERVDHDGAFTSRRGPGEGSFARRRRIRQARPKSILKGDSGFRLPRSRQGRPVAFPESAGCCLSFRPRAEQRGGMALCTDGVERIRARFLAALSRESPEAGHSRESGNPAPSGLMWTPAYAGVTRRAIFIPLAGPQPHDHSE